MSDPRDRGGPPIDSDAFQEWVEHTAETRGVDEQELLNQLVSSFWILDEVDSIRESGDTLNSSEPLYPPDSLLGLDERSDARTDTTRDSADNHSNGTDESRREGERDAPPDDRDRKDTETDDRDRKDTGTDDSDEPAEPDSVADEFRTLRESMHGQLELIQTVAELRRQISDLSLDVEQQRSRQDQFTDRISDDLTRLHSRVETLDNRIDESESVDETALTRLSEELDQLSEEFDGEVSRIDATQQDLEAWVDEEFDEIEGLFERLIDTTDALDDRIDALDDRIEGLESELGTLRDDAADDRLAGLRRDAIALGTDTGRCENCEYVIDLSMLDEAVCPDCGATFDAVEPAGGWNPLSKPLLRTAVDVPDAN